MKPEDRAQELELIEWEQRQKHAILPEPAAESATHYRDPHCGEEIPEARRKAWPGVQFCAACQTRREKARGRYGAN